MNNRKVNILALILLVYFSFSMFIGACIIYDASSENDYFRTVMGVCVVMINLILAINAKKYIDDLKASNK